VPVGVSVWRIEGGQALPLERTHLANEKLLEDILEKDIGLLGLPSPLLVIGRQVVTSYSGRVDLLCIDQEGTLYAVEIKKDRTPREVVAQAMDYGYWIRDLTYEDVRAIHADYHDQTEFEDSFRNAFQLEPPEAINVQHQLVIVASELDPASERIVTYSKGFGVPINVAFFQTFEENGTQYLTRTWLTDPTGEVPVTKPSQAKKQQEPWNGRDWYVSFGEGETRSWEDAERFRFVSAGGGPWYSGTLKKLPVGGCVFVNVPPHGYVGIGVVVGTAVPVRDFKVLIDGQPKPLADVAIRAPGLAKAAGADDDDTEWVVPVSWVKTVAVSQAISFKGRYGNQNSATRLTHALTRETVLQRFGVTEEALDSAASQAQSLPSEPST
jgi:hypothetical protein